MCTTDDGLEFQGDEDQDEQRPFIEYNDENDCHFQSDEYQHPQMYDDKNISYATKDDLEGK